MGLSLMSKKLKSYRLDAKTISLISELKSSLDLDSNSAVVRKALTLLKIASTAQSNGGSFIIRDNNNDIKVVL